MVYKIQIVLTVAPDQPVSLEPFRIRLKLTNIGDSVFPGGEFTRIAVRIGELNQDIRRSELGKIPSINANESLEFGPYTFRMIDSGPAWVHVDLVASDGQEVNLYQNPETNMGLSWVNAIAIKAREYEAIIGLLQKIVGLLEERGES